MPAENLAGISGVGQRLANARAAQNLLCVSQGMTADGGRKEFTPRMGSLPGSTRTVLARRHALLDPASHVRGGLPGFSSQAAIVLISPRMGANFVQFLIDLKPGESGGSSLPEMEIESFFYLSTGAAVSEMGSRTLPLSPGSFFFAPPGNAWTLRARETGACGVLIQKTYAALPGVPAAAPVVGRAEEVEGLPFLGDPDALLQTFLPDNLSFDMAVNLFTFRPGAALPFVEVHVMEHGLLMLEGRGIYRLEDSWYPVQAGDAIWMAPYCPQWFAALGPGPARYLYYKDTARHPLGG
ncbi:MAG: (S)-ureidoglycine aminohydrolase [Methylacidiphilaceae bacterium]|nr:(S)-ureidoglycine aminohydrolase [Candidatus Methylacidiphilaceae bacterium]